MAGWFYFELCRNDFDLLIEDKYQSERGEACNPADYRTDEEIYLVRLQRINAFADILHILFVRTRFYDSAINKR